LCFPFKVEKLEKDWGNPGRPHDFVGVVSLYEKPGLVPDLVPGIQGCKILRKDRGNTYTRSFRRILNKMKNLFGRTPSRVSQG
jgi:hypothetical protein